MGLVLVIILILLMFGGLPVIYPHNYGYYPSGIIFVILVVVLMLMLLGHF